MFELKDVYAKKKRNNKTSEETIKECINHPSLMRRLVCLYEDKVKLHTVKENPWYDEMKQYNITTEMVADAKDFINFCLKEEEKKRKAYILAMAE